MSDPQKHETSGAVVWTILEPGVICVQVGYLCTGIVVGTARKMSVNLCAAEP